MMEIDVPTTESDALVAKERLWFFHSGSIDMEWTPEDFMIEIIEHGPFPEEILREWPENLRKDYLELLGLDLATMGLDGFKRMSRAIGEAYLLSLGVSIESDAVLLKSWKIVSDGVPPPPPSFTERTDKVQGSG